MKILFLDIDGVLNNHQTDERFEGLLGISYKLTARLNKWLRENPDVKVVLSSFWRLQDSGYQHVKDMLVPDVIIDKTVLLNTREEEIFEWVERNNPDVWVALDDLPLKLNKPNFVQTDLKYGLTQYELDQLTERFNA